MSDGAPSKPRLIPPGEPTGAESPSTASIRFRRAMKDGRGVRSLRSSPKLPSAGDSPFWTRWASVNGSTNW